MKNSTTLKLIALSGIAASVPSAAYAHGGGDHVHGLVAGLEHPIFGLDHLLAMVAVGAIAARAGGRAAFLAPLSFVLAMLAGAVLGMAGIGLPAVETGIALSLVVFGALVGLYRPLPLSAAAALAALFGLFHGHAHGLEAPATASGLAYAAGFVLSTSTSHAVGVFSGTRLARWPAVLRVAGIGTSLLGLAMTMQAA